MTWEEATGALLSHFISQWAVLHAGMPVDVPNGEPISITTDQDPFVRLRFIPSFANRIALGGQLREQGGRVVVNTFTPRNAGDSQAISLDRDIESIWEDAHDNGLSGAIHLGAPEPLPAMPDPDVPLYRSGVAISFLINHSP